MSVAGGPRHAQPPHLLLDRVAGWRTAVAKGVTLTPGEGSWTLEPLPGQAERLLAAARQEAAFRCPSALAEEPCGGLLVADAALDRVFRLESAGRQIETLPFGGAGAAPRRLREPRGVASLPGGAVAVAEAGNHRIQVFAPATWALVRVLGATGRGRRPVAGDGPLQFRRPWALAAGPCGGLWVVDRGNHRLQRIAGDGSFARVVGAADLSQPTDLAVAPDGRVAVADPGAERVVVFSSTGRRLAVLEGLQLPSSVAFGAAGRLYVGDGIGRVHVFASGGGGGERRGDPRTGGVWACDDRGPFPLAAPEGSPAGTWRRVGVGVTGLDGPVVDLLWTRSRDLVALVEVAPEDHRRGRLGRSLWRIDPAAAFAGPGTLITRALDSRIEECAWHRVELDAGVPPGTSVEIDSFTSEVHPPVSDPTDPGFADWQPCVLAGDSDPDCLVQSAPGRYLWLRLRLRTNGLASPEVRAIRVFYPRRGYLRYLPAVFQEDEESRHFLERFLAVFQTPFDDLNQRIGRLWQLFDPASVPAAHLRWLAAWLAVVVEPEWPEAKLREVVGKAVAAYKVRGTAAGIERAIRDYAGVEASILEHYRLRRWPALALTARLDGSARLWSRDFYRRLQLGSYSQLGYFRLTEEPEPALEPHDWGAHRFSVLFEADPYRLDETRRRVAAVVEREKPAHTTATLCPVYPRLRVGVQATVGLDARVAGVSHLVLNRLATLSYDSILACSTEELALRGLGTTSRPRAGVSARLQ